MKQSHLSTPRTLDECHFTHGYTSVGPQRSEPAWERVAGYVLAVAIGTALAVALVYGWSN